jgi:GTP-binding protein
MNYNNAAFEAAYGTSAQLPKSDLPEIAFSGRSNVGKSSLLNKLTNRKQLARVSGTPGKTVTVNFFRVGDVRLCDLPGYGYARVGEAEKRRWSDLMEGYFQSGRNIRLVVQLVDMRHPPSADDISMLKFMQSAQIPFVIALTKSDKLNKTGREQRLKLLKEELAFLGEFTAIPFSSLNGEGVKEIQSEIERALS